MSMFSTLAKVAVGVMVAKTVGKAVSNSGGLSDMLGGLLGGKDGKEGSLQGGKLPELMNSLGGGKAGGLGDLLSSALSGEKVDPTKEQEDEAKILLKAMIASAKADGKIDQDEQKKITEHIGDVTPEELEFVKQELASPLDVNALVSVVPENLKEQVYLISLATINLDTKEEAEYLDKLAKGLNISQQSVNQIHEKLGAPKLYS